MLIKSATSYKDPGAIAMDDVDGDITAKIVKTGTVNMNTMGGYTVTYMATDNATNRTVVSRTVRVVRDKFFTDLLVRYAVPAESPLPALQNKVYVNIQVDGEGPDLSAVVKLNFSWSLVNGSLYDFAVSLTGAPYLLSLTSTRQTFSQHYPAMTLTNTTIPGLDGNYYVTALGDEFIWVEESGKFAIIWSE
ncbi:MAG: DUF5011 domain-containing protein [Chitinispirillaceae bacterium]|nr:DUF5011 domain-containing protein [Chitinispirillaceae bacterium]